MDFVQLYTTTDGRICRKTWWLGVIGMVIISIVLSMVLAVPFQFISGGNMSGFTQGIMELILLGIFFVPYRALTLKRLHDRNRPENLFWIFYAPSLASAAVKILGIGGSMATTQIFGQSVEAYTPNMIGQLVNLASMGIGIWALIELGIMKGDTGANEHGPDPLANEL